MKKPRKENERSPFIAERIAVKSVQLDQKLTQKWIVQSELKTQT